VNQNFRQLPKLPPRPRSWPRWLLCWPRLARSIRPLSHSQPGTGRKTLRTSKETTHTAGDADRPRPLANLVFLADHSVFRAAVLWRLNLGAQITPVVGLFESDRALPQLVKAWRLRWIAGLIAKDCGGWVFPIWCRQRPRQAGAISASTLKQGQPTLSWIPPERLVYVVC